MTKKEKQADLVYHMAEEILYGRDLLSKEEFRNIVKANKFKMDEIRTETGMAIRSLYPNSVWDEEYLKQLFDYWFEPEILGKGYYQYTVKNYRGDYSRMSVLVDVLDESDKSYRIRLLEKNRVKTQKEFMWVRKKSVVLNDSPTIKEIDTTDFWYSNI